MKVLILSSSDDGHATEVAKCLKEDGVEHDFFRYEEFVTRTSFVYTLGMPEKRCKIERSEGRVVDLYSYFSIWHRRPGNIDAGKFPEAWIGQMVAQEGRNAIEGMLYPLRCLWMNYPPNDFACMQKLLQLDVGKQVGLKIPETLVTNKPEVVREFFDQCDGHVIYKLLGEGSNFAIPSFEHPRGISTLPLRKVDLEHISQVAFSPHLFQRKIHKQCDLRVTIVGAKIFAISIDSQAGKGALDWRNDYSVEMVPCELPETLQTQCLDLMKRLGLNYGALDFILSENGDYIFLEINCAGQYLWIEQKTDLRISREIANLLTGKSKPLVPARGDQA